MDYQQSFNGGRPSMRIRILVVDDQYTSLNMATTSLRSLKYEVLTAKHPFEALYTLRLMQGGIDLVISDYHMPDMNGVQLQKQIYEEFNIPVIMMSVDSREFVVVESLRGGSKVFLVKPIQVEKVENVWQYVVANNKGKSPISSVGVDRPVRFHQQDPRLSMQKELEEATAGNNNKNHKVIWTNALHTLFLQAINQIGLEKAVPKKIRDRMNVPGLTRQQVASHLQKYRNFLKKVAERGLVKCDDPQKALNEAFEMIMASNDEYHDMILSMPPSQFGRSQSQHNLGSSWSSDISSGRNNIDQCGVKLAPNALLENSGSYYNVENGVRIMDGNEYQFPARLGLGLNSNNNHITMGTGSSGNEHLIPSRLALSNVFQNDKSSSFNINVLNSTPALTTNLQENSTSIHIDQVSPYVQDELKPTLGDDIFDSLSNLLVLPQGNGDIDMALEYAPHLLDDQQPITTNQPEDQKWDHDFIGSLLVDGGPYMEADDERSS